MRKFALLACAALLLAGCTGSAGTAPAAAPNYSSIVGMIQTNYGQLTTAANAYSATTLASSATKAQIAKIEAQDGPLVAGLSSTSPPTTITAVLQDLNYLSTVPGIGKSIPNPSQTQQDITQGLTILTSAAQIAASVAPLAALF
jgi:hypothetical protein